MENKKLLGNQVAKRLLIEMYNNQHRYNHEQHRYNYAARLAREIDCTHAHCIANGIILEEVGVITRTIDGRKIILIITDKGREIAKHLVKIEEILRC